MSALRIGSLFSGSGMLDEGVRSVMGGEVAWHCEYEPPTEKNPKPTQAAARVLAHRYPDVPNHGDVATVNWSAVEPIDVLTGGFPCQDVSHAGKRAGMRAGTRSGQWARMCDAIDALRPSLAVIENVRGLTSACADSEMGCCPRCVGVGPVHRPVLRGLGRVLGDLAELGYDASWYGLPASDIGAPHERFRLFILAQHAAGPRLQGPAVRRLQSAELGSGRDAASDTDNGTGHGEWSRPEPRQGDPVTADAECGRRGRRAPDAQRRPLERAAATRPGEDAAPNSDCDALRLQSVPFIGSRPETVAGRDHEAAADANRDGRPLVGRQLASQRDTHRRGSEDIAWGDYEPAIRRWEALTRAAPAPTEPGTRGGRRLSRWFDEWMMGWPDGWVTDVPGITYREAIRVCGNGVVRQQAAEAQRQLLAALNADGAVA